MGQVLHGSATTTEAIRRAIQHSQESLRALAKRYGIKPEDRREVEGTDHGHRPADWTEGATLDGSLLPAASWHRPASGCRGRQAGKEEVQELPDWLLPHDVAEVRTEQGKLHMFVAIDRTSKFAFVELHEKATTAVSRDFLLRLIAAVPYKIHTVLTDNGIQFTTPGAGGSAVPLIKEAIANGERFWAHAFEYACATNDIEHRTTKARHPWTNGQVERMNRTIKEATVKRFYYESHDQLRQHLADFVAAYNFVRRLKTLKGLTPYEFICKAWATQPGRFKLNPLHQMPGLNT